MPTIRHVIHPIARSYCKAILIAVLCSCPCLSQAPTDVSPGNNTSPGQHRKDGIRYVDAPSANWQEPAETVRKWASDFNDDAIRAHGWKLWAELTKDSGQTYEGSQLPVWDTWYSEWDVFEHNSEPMPHLPVHLLRQSPESRVTSFNKYNNALRQYVKHNKFDQPATFVALNKSFGNAALSERKIPIVPNDAIMLKPAYWGAKKDQVSVMPFWKGPGLKVDGTVYPDKPTDQTWTQIVLVNDTGKPAALTPRTVTLFTATGKEVRSITPSKEVTPRDFYALRLTQADITFLKSGKVFEFGGIPANELEPGDWALLIAMHVTSKEWENWTWQTFWWTPYPSNESRPDIRSPWTNYDMASAYYMTDRNSEPYVIFNPFLETPISGPIFMDPDNPPELSARGVRTNCMTCHRVAAFPTLSTIPTSPTMSSYKAVGEVKGDEQLFKDRVQTSFMWAMVIINQLNLSKNP